VPGSARAAVASQAGLLSALLQSPDNQIRMAVTWVLAQSEPAEYVFPALHAQWDVEEVPSIRATLLKAMPVLGSTPLPTLTAPGSSAWTPPVTRSKNRVR
jgi:hypothetical protein